MKKNSTDFWLWLAVVAIVVIFADLVLILFSNGNLVSLPTHYVFPYSLDTNSSESFWAQRGQWGDILSGHFAAMAFILLFYTAMLQRRELKEMREEAAQQTSEFKIQTTYMKYDRLFSQLRQYIDGIYIRQSQSQEVKIKGYSALSEILDKNKRPNSNFVNFAQIKTLIVVYISVVLFLNKENNEIKEALSRELAIVISADDIKLLWKLYVCVQGINMGYDNLQQRYDAIENENKKMLDNESLKIWFEDMKSLLSMKNEKPDVAFKNLYSELKG